MTHFGIICPSEAGHLNPVIPLGCELKIRGHRVTIFGTLNVQSKVLASGLEFYLIGKSTRPEATLVESTKRRGELTGLAALRYTLSLVYQDTAITLRDVPDAIKLVGVDALLIDQCSQEGGTIAESLDIPFISICGALLLNREAAVPPVFTTWSYSPTWQATLRNRSGYAFSSYLHQPIWKLIAEYRQKWKLPPYPHSDNYYNYAHPNDYYSKLAQLSHQPAEFDFPRQHLPQCFHFTGPYHSPAGRESTSFPFDRLTGQPLIYASLGTLQNRLEYIFQYIAESCVGLDAQLVISLGGGIKPDSLSNLPGDPLVVVYAPQLELLKQAALTITHAGLNTTLESLSHGVPMIAIPIANDQPGVAARIAWTGTGEVVPLSQLSFKLKEAVKRVLTEKSYKQNAGRLQAAIHYAGGVGKAVDIIEQAISTQQPVLVKEDTGIYGKT